MAQIQELKKEIEKLKDKTQLNSRNSSIPPSKDPLDAPPRPEKRKTGKKRGGQNGHKGKRRELLPVKDVDDLITYIPTCCEKCKKPLSKKARASDPPPLRHQVFDLRKKAHEVIEYQGHARGCTCGHVTRAEIPQEVAGSNFGPRLVAMLSMLIGGFQVSRRNAEEFVEDAIGMPISLGSVSNLEAEVTEALEDSYQEVAQKVRNAPSKNVDETGWKKAGDKCWLWTAATSLVAFFVIHKQRGKDGFRALIGEKLKGFFTSDRWHVYGAIKKGFRQVCWAHLKRDFQRLVDRGGERAEIGRQGLEIVSQVFWLWKDFKAGVISRQTLGQCLRPIKKQMREVLKQGVELQKVKVSKFCENLLALEPALWNFAYHEGLEPTNNHAERILRRGVLWRHRSFGANSERGCRYVERILTATQTCRLQKRRIFDFLVRSIEAHRTGRVPPSLVTP